MSATVEELLDVLVVEELDDVDEVAALEDELVCVLELKDVLVVVDDAEEVWELELVLRILVEELAIEDVEASDNDELDEMLVTEDELGVEEDVRLLDDEVLELL